MASDVTLQYLIGVVRSGKSSSLASSALKYFNILFHPRGMLGLDRNSCLNLVLLDTRDNLRALPNGIVVASDIIWRCDRRNGTLTVLRDTTGHYTTNDIINTDGKLVGLVITGESCDILYP